MNTEVTRTCLVCGARFPATNEFCPICMLREALDEEIKPAKTFLKGIGLSRREKRPPHRFEHYELVIGKDGKPVLPSSLLTGANSDTEPDSPVATDSAPKAPRKIQTGQNSLSVVAKNFVPQIGQVRASCCPDPNSLQGSSSDPPDSVFTV